MTNENRQKLECLLDNQDEINAIFVGDADQVLANFAAHGIEMDKDELGELCAGIMDGMGISEDGELSENDLESVAGGGLRTSIAIVIGLAGAFFGRGLKDGISGNPYSCKNNIYKPCYDAGYKIGKHLKG